MILFLAPGDDDGTGFAERYEFYHHEAFTDVEGLYSCPGDTESYTLLLSYTTPLEGGEREAILLTDLTPNNGHCVFMVAFDDYRSPQFPEGQSSGLGKYRSIQDLRPNRPGSNSRPHRGTGNQRCES